MCGIAGVISEKPIPESLAPQILDSLRHRGPDDEGFFVTTDRKALLVHTRLSILDLSPAGHQPMTNEDGSLQLVYNGEIYNFEELRQELLSKGHRFQSKTDTEVILHLYEEEGEGLVQRLIGMFAFALLDLSKRRLLLARDRLGIKPLYYAESRGNFLFGSEIKAILATGLISAEVNWQAISDYFTFLFVPHPQTAFREIRQLPPAHTLIYDLKTRELRLHRYWNVWENAHRQTPSYPELREQVRTLLSRAVQSELASDVPLGVFFSGGIDSTLITALMRQRASEPVKTFTVIFSDLPGNWRQDLEYARLASRILETEHHELTVELKRPEECLHMIRHVDQPFANPTLLLQFLIAQATRRHVSVALSGVGGDELFGGYPKYPLFTWAPWLGLLPRGFGNFGSRMLSLVREDTWEPILRKTKRLLRGIGYPLEEQYLRWSYSLSDSEKRNLIPGCFRNEPFQPSIRVVREILSRVPAGTHRQAQVLLADLETFLVDNLLDYTDKATMAVALETRVPFLDHRLVELSFQIPFHMKVRAGKTKWILTDAFEKELPKEIVQAPKRGFSPPIALWMEKVLDHYFEEGFFRQRIEAEGIFSWKAIERLRVQHRTKRRDASQELMAVLMFETWYRQYVLKEKL